MALHQRQRQSCKRRTLPQVLSHTVHLALTGRFPSSHWCGIEICKWYRGREAIWAFQSATQGRRMHCGTETYKEASLYMHCLRTAKAISGKTWGPLLAFYITLKHKETRWLAPGYPGNTDLHMLRYCCNHSFIFLLPKLRLGSPCLQLFNLNSPSP